MAYLGTLMSKRQSFPEPAGLKLGPGDSSTVVTTISPEGPMSKLAKHSLPYQSPVRVPKRTIVPPNASLCGPAFGQDEGRRNNETTLWLAALGLD